MLKGIHLTLLVGPTIPVPVPQFIIDSLTDVEVRTHARSKSAFRLTFTVSNRSPLSTLFLISAGGAPKLIRVILIATVQGLPDVLFDGVMTNHQFSPGSSGSPGKLIITGEDLKRVMDYVSLDGTPYPGMTPEARVATILAKYSAFGIIPLIVPTFSLDVESPTHHVPHHKGTDLYYVEYLAKEVGYVFFLRPGPVPGVNVAYWGPDVKVGLPQAALSLDMDAHRNVESINFSYDSEHRTQPVVMIQVPIINTAIPVPIPSLSPFNPPLGLIPPPAKRIAPVEGTAKLSPVKALLKGLATASETSNCVRATGSLDVARYGQVLKARNLVGVRGAGVAFDGMYYVESVTNNLQRGQFKQSFELSRNALVSTLPRVPV